MASWIDQVLGRGRSSAAQGGPAERRLDLLDALSDWILRVSADGVLRGANRPTDSPFPHVRDADIGRPAADLFPERAGEVLEELIPRTLANDKASTFEYTFEGTWAEVRMFPRGDDEVVLVARDLTGRKATESTLRRGRERYALAVQGANDGLWDWQLDTDEVYWSLQWKTLLGLDPGEVSPTPSAWFDRIHPEDLERVQADLGRHLAGDTPRFESEHRIRHADGSWRWVLVRGMALRDARGRPTRIAGSLTDLTERRVVAAAEEKSKLLEYATRAVGIGILLLLPDGGLANVSPTLQEMVDAWPDPEGWWLDVRAVTELPRGIRCPTCRRRQHVGSMLAEIEEPEGDPRVFEITVTGHAHEVHHTGDAHVVLVEDVTEPKLAEQRLKLLNAQLIVARDRALASSRAKSTFLANMSHELRTPLNAILGYSEMLLEDLEHADIEVGVAELQRINTAGGQLLELISGVLDLSKVEAGLMAPEIRAFDVLPLVREVVTLIEGAVQSSGNVFEWHCPSHVGGMVSDAGKLRQILQNLLSNANKFTERGTVRLEVREDGPDHLVFEVSDTGIGIEPEAQQRLFEDFFQGDLSSTKRYGGAGLGLALTHRFVRMLGGTIGVESTPGEGATFTARLPRHVPQDEVPTEPPAPGRDD